MTRLPKFSELGRYLTLGNRPAPAWFLGFVVVGLLAVLTVVYGHAVTHSAVFLNDSFVFFDGIHRVANGQVPHVDFSTPVGALGYWLPYVGYSIVDGYSGAVEVASLILGAIVVPLAGILLWQRAAPVMAVLALATIACIIVVPLVPGWKPGEVSHAMHYNRWSWGIILALFLLGLPPKEDAKSGPSRGVIAAMLLASLFFIKITYFVIGSVYLLLLLSYVDARRRDAILAIGGAGVILLVSVVITGSMVPRYFADIQQALDAGTAVRGSYLDIALINRHSLVLFVLAIYAGIIKANLKWQDLLMAGYIGAASLAIIDQNFQFTFIVALPAAFALLAAPRNNVAAETRLADAVIVATCAAMLLPFVADWARVTVRHMADHPSKEFVTLDVPGFENFFVYDRQTNRPPEVSAPATPIDSQAYLRGEVAIKELNQMAYMPALEDAVRLLKSAGVENSTIFTLEFSNFIPLLVDAPREPYGYSWVHMGRNVGPDTLPSAVKMFDGIDYVMGPLQTITPMVDDYLDPYGAYFSSHLTEVAQSEFWVLFRHNPDGN